MKTNNTSQSLSEFKRNSSAVIERMAESGEPVVLTVNGAAKLIVQDAASYQRLVDSVDYSEAVKGVRRGLDDVAAGHTKSVTQVFSAIRKRHRSSQAKAR